MDQTTSSVYLLQHIGVNAARQFDQAINEQLGIGMSQYRILNTLKSFPDSQQKLIAASLGQTEASISRQVKILINKGLISVFDNPSSKRDHVVSLSPKGLQVIDAALDLFNKLSHAIFSDLNSKQIKA